MNLVLARTVMKFEQLLYFSEKIFEIFQLDFCESEMY